MVDKYGCCEHCDDHPFCQFAVMGHDFPCPYGCDEAT